MKQQKIFIVEEPGYGQWDDRQLKEWNQDGWYVKQITASSMGNVGGYSDHITGSTTAVMILLLEKESE